MPTNKSGHHSPALKQIAKEIFHLDRNIPKTVWKLFSRPGHLTNASFHSPNEKWVHPFKLYLAINLIFFILTPLLNSSNFEVFSFDVRSRIRLDEDFNKKIEKACVSDQISKEIYIERFNAHIKYNQPALMFLIIPFWGLLLQIMYIHNRLPFSLHLTHAMHLLAFFLMLLLLAQGLFQLFKLFGLPQNILGLLVIPLIGLCFLIYLFRSLKNVCPDKIGWTLLKSGVLFIGFFLILGVYVNFLFHYTYLALKSGY